MIETQNAPARVSPRAWSRAAAVAFLLALAPAAAAQVHAAEPEPKAASAAVEPSAAEPAKASQRTPEDRWSRGTPRGAMRGFLEAGRDGRWEDAAAALDLSAFPESERASRGTELARKLKFLLDEDLWIDLELLSDEPAGNRDDGLSETRELVGNLASHAGGLSLYLEQGPREDGQLVWRIAASTLARVPAVYAQIGPPAMVDRLPRALHDTHFLEIALWQWIGLILLVTGAWIAAWLSSSLVVRILKPLTLKSETDIDDQLLALMVGPIRLLITVGAFNAGLHVLRLSVPANTFAREASKFLVIAGVAWLVLRVIDLFASISKERFLQRGQAGAAHLVPLGARAIKVAVFLMTVLATLDTFGFDVTAIIAGLGVGGLAVALAAQKTVENVFGGVSVLVDQPIRPGDFCRFGDKQGTVEDIGLRSTRIRTLDRTVVSVPNSEFSNLHIENFAKRDRILLKTNIGLRYETTPDQLRHVIAALRSLLLAHPKVLPDPVRVRFVGFGAFSLDLEMFAYVDTIDAAEFLAVREDVFLRVMDVVAASGCGFAFPSSTTYVAQDGGLDREKRAAAEAEVRQLRAEGRLAFPDHSAEEVAALDDTLDWPPKGSAASLR